MQLKESSKRISYADRIAGLTSYLGCGYYDGKTLLLRPNERWVYNSNIPTVAERNPMLLYGVKSVRHFSRDVCRFIGGILDYPAKIRFDPIVRFVQSQDEL